MLFVSFQYYMLVCIWYSLVWFWINIIQIKVLMAHSLSQCINASVFMYDRRISLTIVICLINVWLLMFHHERSYVSRNTINHCPNGVFYAIWYYVHCEFQTFIFVFFIYLVGWSSRNCVSFYKSVSLSSPSNTIL